MENQNLPTVSYKSSWGRHAKLFDVAYNEAMKINSANTGKRADTKLMLECMKEARGQSDSMRSITMAVLKLSVELSNNVGAQQLFANPETKPALE